MDNKAMSPVFQGYRWRYFPSLRPGALRQRVDTFLELVEWAELMKYASRKRDGNSCALLPDIGLGYNHMVRVLLFSDGVRWVARLTLPPLSASKSETDVTCTDEMASVAAGEYWTMLAVQQNTNIPVPLVHAFEQYGSSDIIKFPFMLMDCIKGNIGMDLGMQLPFQHKEKFLKSLAKIHVQLASIKLPKIGIITGINADGTFQQGPLPRIGGPFDTATEFFQAWADAAGFGRTEEMIRQSSGEYTEEILSAIASFPNSIRELAADLSTQNKGPFPLVHGDFGHKNIIVDDNYDLLSVIDWEMAFAAPWVVFGDFPLSIGTTPPVMDLPWNYDGQGNPTDPNVAQRLADQQEYIKAVQEEESKMGMRDSVCLSEMLLDTKRQQMQVAMRLYDRGKIRLYSRQVKQFLSS